MTLKFFASVGISKRHWYQVCGQPWINRSGGPSPPITACRRRPLASTYRLVNVLANPSGRYGAPEAEPGPRGTRAEEESRAAASCVGRRPTALTAAEAVRTSRRETIDIIVLLIG